MGGYLFRRYCVLTFFAYNYVVRAQSREILVCNTRHGAQLGTLGYGYGGKYTTLLNDGQQTNGRLWLTKLNGSRKNGMDYDASYVRAFYF